MTSLAARIQADLERKIRSNLWVPGTRIPTEHELMEQYDCARMTVHNAITKLVALGLIERRKKAGSFVASPQVQTAVIAIPDIKSLIERRGKTYRYKLLSRTIGRSPGKNSKWQEPDFDVVGPVLVLQGLHYADDLPLCLEFRVINLFAAPRVRTAHFEGVPPGAWLLQHIPWSEARHRITARPAGSASKHLGVRVSEPCLSLERWTWNQRKPVTYAQQIFPGNQIDLVEQFSPKAARTSKTQR